MEGQELTDTPGFVPGEEADEGEETPGFTAREGGKGDGASARRGRRPKGDGEKAEAKKRRQRPGAKAGDGGAGPKDRGKAISEKERAEKLKQAREERRARMRGQQQEEEEQEADEELILDRLTHHVSLEDLEQYLGIAVVPDDRSKLERRWQQKARDPSIRHLLADASDMQHSYALVPRLNRFFKGGKAVNTTVVELLRNYPQLFESPASVINKYKAEAFFSRETPELDWAIVACEVLPDSRNKSYMQQKSVIKQYAEKHRANERRIRRRTLVEALYDMVIINVTTKENILSSTVDLTESKVGRQNFACINFGEKGMRINDVGRQQRHPQMGMCPSW